MRRFHGAVGVAVILGALGYAGRAEASPVVSISSPTAGATVGNSVDVTAKVTDAAAIASVTVDIGGVTQALTAVGGLYGGTVDISALPAGNIMLTVTATDGLGDTAMTTETVDHEVPVAPPPPPPPAPPAPCASLDGGSPNLVLVNGVTGDTILDWDATRILYVSSTGISIKSRVDGTITALSSATPTVGRLYSTGATWSTSAINPYFVVGGDYETYIVDSTIYRVLLTTGATESITVAGVYGTPTIDASGTGYVTYTTPGMPNTFSLMGWPVGGSPTAISVSAKDAAIWGSQIAWSKHWTSIVYPESTLIPGAGQPQVMLDGPPGGFMGPGGTIKRSGFDYDVRNGWTAYTHVVGTQLQAWTRAPDGTTALASPYGSVLLAGMNGEGEIVVDSYSGGTSTRSLSKANGALPTVPVQLGGNRGRMQYIAGVWYEALGCALFRVGAGSVDPSSGVTPPTPPDAGADAGGTDAGDAGGAVDDAGDAGNDGSTEPDAGAGEDAGEGGGSSSSSSSTSSSSGSAGAGSAGTPPSGVDDGSCATGGSSPAGVLSSALVAFAAALLARGRRRRRR